MSKTCTLPSITRKRVVPIVLQKAGLKYICVQGKQISYKNDLKVTLKSPQKVCCKF